MDSYGARLEKAIQLSAKDRVSLARHLGVTKQAVGQIINGYTQTFRAENSARAARFLGVDHYWLATGEGEPMPKAGGKSGRDSSGRYVTDQWPFDDITPARYYALTPSERADIEARVRLEIELAEKKRPQKNHA